MTKPATQFVVVEQEAILPNQQVEEAALFYPDGSVYVPPSSEPGETIPALYNSLALFDSDTDSIVTQGENGYNLASLKMNYAIQDTTVEWWKIITFDASLWFFDQEEGLITIHLDQLLRKVPELGYVYVPPGGIKAFWQGQIGQVEKFGMLAYPENTTGTDALVLDMLGVPITTELLTADNITFNASWLIRNND